MPKKKKEEVQSDKLRGGYYTPREITQFICRWAITRPTQKTLEPSCGDGNFMEAAVERYQELGVNSRQLSGLVHGVELIPAEAEKSRARVSKYGLSVNAISNTDFFHFVDSTPEETAFDVVIGNPPFIRYQNFPEEHRAKAFEMMEAAGLSPNKLTNIWVPFLVLSARLLTRHGRLGMVIPAELFQVKYAAETRVFLSNFFPRITIVTFRKLVFADIQQEVVLLLCEKGVRANPGIRVLELPTLESLEALNVAEVQEMPVKTLEHNSEKWTKYFLEEEEIQLLRRIKTESHIRPASDVMDVDIGLVTGRNEFFMMNKETAANWRIKPYTQRVVGRSAHLKGILFSEQDFEENSEANIESFLFLPPNKDFKDLPQACKQYILHGEELSFHKGYKCSIRKRWYITPSQWTPSAFALRQVNEFPKLIVNQAGASCTDTIHRVRFKTTTRPEIVALSFLNSLSFAFSEIIGRSYGGGVLTFEPTEIEEIPLPLLKDAHDIDFAQIDLLMRERKIDEVLDIVDKTLLVNQLQMSEVEVKALRKIWKKLSGRRLDRK